MEDVFIILIDHLELYRTWTEKHQMNFLVKCCRCIAINKFRAYKRKNSKEFSLNVKEGAPAYDLPDESAEVERPVISQENQRKLSELIESMDPKYGDILYLKAFLNMKNIEIAERLQISVDLVNVRVMRARRMLAGERNEVLNEIF